MQAFFLYGVRSLTYVCLGDGFSLSYVVGDPTQVVMNGRGLPRRLMIMVL
nr:hypothetical protein [uncultured Psychrobacter sp.]